MNPTLRRSLPKIIEEQSEQSIEIDSRQYDSPDVPKWNIDSSPETNEVVGESALKNETEDEDKF